MHPVSLSVLSPYSTHEARTETKAEECQNRPRPQQHLSIFLLFAKSQKQSRDAAELCANVIASPGKIYVCKEEQNTMLKKYF